VTKDPRVYLAHILERADRIDAPRDLPSSARRFLRSFRRSTNSSENLPATVVTVRRNNPARTALSSRVSLEAAWPVRSARAVPSNAPGRHEARR
jgi:hypothetical protein